MRALPFSAVVSQEMLRYCSRKVLDFVMLDSDASFRGVETVTADCWRVSLILEIEPSFWNKRASIVAVASRSSFSFASLRCHISRRSHGQQ